MVARVELDSGHQVGVSLQNVHTLFSSCAVNFHKVPRDTEDVPGKKERKIVSHTQ